ncbi:helix-turn-helix domain-containing protein, partial [Sphingomonas bacterium]|uniref:helix-turn-helix domain-containing protein n=1 Tax=Sphingomonas bacterium TaxID=1895847 RepID=UPI001C2DEB6A
AAAAERMRRVAGRGETAALIPPDTVSPRQFRRLFERQVGMAPKRYARIIRLGAALAAKSAAPERSWTDIAHDFGWFDQAHLDKDFRALAGSIPSAYPLAHQVER